MGEASNIFEFSGFWVYAAQRKMNKNLNGFETFETCFFKSVYNGLQNVSTEKDVLSVLLWSIKNVSTAAAFAWERQNFWRCAKHYAWAYASWGNIIGYSGWPIKNSSVCISASDCWFGMGFVCDFHGRCFAILCNKKAALKSLESLESWPPNQFDEKFPEWYLNTKAPSLSFISMSRFGYGYSKICTSDL